MTDDDPDAALWIGPAQASWWKFDLASAWVSLRLRTPWLRHVPGADRVTDRALSIVVGSRDVVLTEGDR